MGVNKISYFDTVLLDLTADTVSPADVMEGKTLHTADGEPRVGTFSLSEELTEQDALIDQIKRELQGKTSGGSAELQSKTVDITVNGRQRILPDAGYDGMTDIDLNINVPQGVFPAGTLNISENGLHPVGVYENVFVDVPQGIFPKDTITITENGSYNVTTFASAIVNVQNAGGLNMDVVTASGIGGREVGIAGLKGTPRAFALISNTQHNASSTAYVESVIYDGSTITARYSQQTSNKNAWATMRVDTSHYSVRSANDRYYITASSTSYGVFNISDTFTFLYFY